LVSHDVRDARHSVLRVHRVYRDWTSRRCRSAKSARWKKCVSGDEGAVREAFSFFEKLQRRAFCSALLLIEKEKFSSDSSFALHLTFG